MLNLTYHECVEIKSRWAGRLRFGDKSCTVVTDEGG
jgi:hypothetical protein